MNSVGKHLKVHYNGVVHYIKGCYELISHFGHQAKFTISGVVQSSLHRSFTVFGELEDPQIRTGEWCGHGHTLHYIKYNVMHSYIKEN